MKKLMPFWILMVAILHHDLWNWKDKTLVLGFVPVGLAYHIGFALLAAVTMVMLVKFAWPHHLEELEDE